MALFELGTFIPIRAGHDVPIAIVIKIAKGGAFAPELIAQLHLFEGMSRGLSCRSIEGTAKKKEEGGVPHVFHLAWAGASFKPNREGCKACGLFLTGPE